MRKNSITRPCEICAVPIEVEPWQDKTGRGRYCSRTCTALGRSANYVARFQARFTDLDPSQCWPWSGTRNTKGYGHVTIGARRFYAHRVAFEIANGPIPNDKIVMHTCDNPPCCNPRHLMLGTTKDNIRDAAARGLMPVGDRHYLRRAPERVLRGQQHPSATITAEVVLSIRARYASNVVSQSALAREFGISQSHVSDIILGKRWAHLANPSESP